MSPAVAFTVMSPVPFAPFGFTSTPESERYPPMPIWLKASSPPPVALSATCVPETLIDDAPPEPFWPTASYPPSPIIV